MLKFSLLLLSSFLLLLSSCTGGTPVQETLPSKEDNTPMSSLSTWSNFSGVSGETTTQTSSVLPSTKTSPSNNTESLSAGTKKLIELQNEKWPNALLEVDCSKYDTEWSKFCKSQQSLIKKFNEETITWEEVLKKWPNYIRTFDCKKITNEFGQKYCLEYKANITVETKDTPKK